MFNLESSIANWREQMLTVGISASELDELESHLREEINEQLRSDVNQSEAFRLAVQKIGQARTLKREFRKTGFDWTTLNRKLAYAVLFLCGLLCCWVLLLASNGLRSVPMSVPCQLFGWFAIVLGISAILSGRLLSRFLPVISRRRTRSLVQFACLLPLIIGFSIYIKWILPNWDYEHFEFGPFLVVNVWVFAALPISYRLCKAFDDAADRHQSIAS